MDFILRIFDGSGLICVNLAILFGGMKNELRVMRLGFDSFGIPPILCSVPEFLGPNFLG